jgi:beta-fructofuranosidase
MDKEQLEKLVRDPQRPRYHFLPPMNWMNDPNGLIQFNGAYHLFYQHNPHGAAWGNITWGHAVSNDMIYWKHLPHALHPDQPYDKGGVFSGCVVNNDSVATAVYTGVRPEVQCIATSADMRTWTKHPANPVIAAPPSGMEVTGFRDPCVWKDGETWFMVVGSGIKDVGGAILLYRSPDLVRWEYVHPILIGDKDKTGTMWECPNFFRLGDKWVLTISPIPFRRAIYFVGAFKDLKFTPEVQGEIDLGGALYAPQLFRDDTGRLILFGWLWENRKNAEQWGWQGAQSLPRVLTLGKDNRLNFAPAKEAKSLRGKHTHFANLTITPNSADLLKDVNDDCLEIVAEIEPVDAQQFGVKVRCSPDGEEETLITYSHHSLAIDRTRSSLADEPEKDVRSAPFALGKDETLRLRIFLDRSVLEVFANGHTCLTSRIYPSQSDSLGVDLFTVGGVVKVKSLDVWEMKS